jgi:hypothetical protein
MLLFFSMLLYGLGCSLDFCTTVYSFLVLQHQWTFGFIYELNPLGFPNAILVVLTLFFIPLTAFAIYALFYAPYLLDKKMSIFVAISMMLFFGLGHWVAGINNLFVVYRFSFP